MATVVSLPPNLRDFIKKYYLIESEETLDDVLSKIDDEFLELEVRDSKTPREFADKILKITKKHGFVEKMTRGDDVKKLEQIVKDAFSRSFPENFFKKGLAIIRNTIRDIYDTGGKKPVEQKEKPPEIVGVKKDNENKIEKHLKPKSTNHGIIHIDSLKQQENYPDYLLLPNPELVKNDLEENGINTFPLIIRPLEDADGEYEVIYGKEIVDFAKKLGIKELRATKVNITEEEVEEYQKTLAKNYSPSKTSDTKKEIAATEPPAQPEVAKTSKRSKKRVIQIPSSDDIEGLKQYIERKSKSIRNGKEILFSAPTLKKYLQDAVTDDGYTVFELVLKNKTLKDKFASLYLGTPKEDTLFDVFPEYKNEVTKTTTNQQSAPVQSTSPPQVASLQSTSPPQVAQGAVKAKKLDFPSTDIKQLKELFNKQATQKRKGKIVIFKPETVKKRLSGLVTSDNKNVFEVFSTNKNLKDYFASLYLSSPKESEFLLLFPEYKNEVTKTTTNQQSAPVQSTSPPQVASPQSAQDEVKTKKLDFPSTDIKQLKELFNKQATQKRKGKIVIFKPETVKKRLSGLVTSDNKNVFEVFSTNKTLKDYFASFYLKSPKESEFLLLFPEYRNKTATSATKQQNEPTKKITPPFTKKDDLEDIHGGINLDRELGVDDGLGGVGGFVDDVFIDQSGDSDDFVSDITDEPLEAPIRPKIITSPGKEYLGKTEELNKEQIKEKIDDILWNIKKDAGNLEKIKQTLSTPINGTTLGDILYNNENLKKYYISFFNGRVDDSVIKKIENIIENPNSLEPEIASAVGEPELDIVDTDSPEELGDIDIPEPEPESEPVKLNPEEKDELTKEINKDVLERTTDSAEEPEPSEVVADLDDKDLVKAIADEPKLIRKYETVFLSNDTYNEFVKLMSDLIMKKYKNSKAAKELKLLPPSKEVSYKGVLKRKNRRNVSSKEPIITPYNEPPKQTYSLPSSNTNNIKIKGNLNRLIKEISDKIQNEEEINFQEISNKVAEMNITKDSIDDEIIEKLYKIYRFLQTFLQDKEEKIIRDANYLTSIKNKIDNLENTISAEFFNRNITSKVKRELNINQTVNLDTIGRADIESTISELEALVDKLENAKNRKIRFTSSARQKYRDLISRIISISSSPKTSKLLNKFDYTRIEELLNRLLELNYIHNNILKECIKVFLKNKKLLALSESKKYLKENILASILRFIGKILGSFVDGFFSSFSPESQRRYYKSRYGFDYDYDDNYEYVSEFKRREQTIKNSQKNIERDIANILKKADDLSKKAAQIEKKSENEINEDDVKNLQEAAALGKSLANLEENNEGFPKNVVKTLSAIGKKILNFVGQIFKKFSNLRERINIDFFSRDNSIDQELEDIKSNTREIIINCLASFNYSISDMFFVTIINSLGYVGQSIKIVYDGEVITNKKDEFSFLYELEGIKIGVKCIPVDMDFYEKIIEYGEVKALRDDFEGFINYVEQLDEKYNLYKEIFNKILNGIIDFDNRQFIINDSDRNKMFGDFIHVKVNIFNENGEQENFTLSLDDFDKYAKLVDKFVNNTLGINSDQPNDNEVNENPPNDNEVNENPPNDNEVNENPPNDNEVNENPPNDNIDDNKTSSIEDEGDRGNENTNDNDSSLFSREDFVYLDNEDEDEDEDDNEGKN
ncbi:MAG: hypothetical protein ABIL47_07550 [candidate division WOR-3 bacterium]